MADIPPPSASTASYLMRRYGAAEGGLVLVCESAVERDEAYHEAATASVHVGHLVDWNDAVRSHRMQACNQVARAASAAKARYYFARYGPGITNIRCVRCDNYSQLFYELSKPGEFRFNSLSEEWTCRWCTEVGKFVAANPRARLLHCPLSRMKKWQRRPSWSLRRRLNLCPTYPCVYARRH